MGHVKVYCNINKDNIINFNTKDPMMFFPVKGEFKKLKIYAEVITGEKLLEIEKRRNTNLGKELDKLYNSYLWIN